MWATNHRRSSRPAAARARQSQNLSRSLFIHQHHTGYRGAFGRRVDYVWRAAYDCAGAALRMLKLAHENAPSTLRPSHSGPVRDRAPGRIRAEIRGQALRSIAVSSSVSNRRLRNHEPASLPRPSTQSAGGGCGESRQLRAARVVVGVLFVIGLLHMTPLPELLWQRPSATSAP